jgi:hypothetical protein
MELTFQERLIKVQSELKAPKGQFNSFGKYKYRNCEDILEAVKPLLTKYGLALMLTDSIEEVAGVLFVNAKAKVWDSEGTSVEVTAQAGIDPDKKGMDISQTFGSASSYARKYALNGLFLIDDTKDADATNTHDKASAAVKSGKTVLPKSGASFTKVKDYLSKGGNMDEVRKKYQITKQVEELLLS